LWDPQTGRIFPLPAYTVDQNSTIISIPFDPAGSAFIVFAPAAAPSLTGITRDGNFVLPKQIIPDTNEPVIDLVHGETRIPGTYVFTTSDGATRQVIVPPLPDPVTVPGPWQVRFPTGWGAPPQITLDNLISWSDHPDPGVKYFSGTATYSKTLTLAPWGADQRIYLDLGNVQIMAKVRLNGKDLGILWKTPYRVDITPAAKPGDNALEIDVVNLWVNRLIGDEQLPEDSSRNSNGTIRSWPQWLLDGKPSPTGRFTFSSWRLWKKSDPLQESGLLGPVTLRTVQHINW
jgi:hypothetical protein